MEIYFMSPGLTVDLAFTVIVCAALIVGGAATLAFLWRMYRRGDDERLVEVITKLWAARKTR